jgi:Mn-dependent DtxR family transcriptional regulator
METSLVKKIDAEKFRLLLQSEFENRRSRNPSYSLRAFAAHLDVHAACLSVILRGKRPLTEKLIERFIQNLALGFDDLQLCLTSESGEKAVKNRVLTLDTFAIISQWYHDAILDLMKLDSFVPDIHWIAETLEITPTEVHSAIERLERCEFIEVTGDGWKLLEPNTDLFVDDITTAGLKRLQRDVLDISKEKIESCSIDKRYHSTMTMAIDVEDIPKAKNMLREFRATFCKTLEEAGNLNDVYELQIGFFPLTNLNKQQLENRK